MFLLAFTSSMPLSLTIHPRVPFFPIRLLWKPACWSTIPKRLILIGFLMEPQETSLSEISQERINGAEHHLASAAIVVGSP